MNGDSIQDNSYLTLADAAKSVPGRPHVSAIWRWCRKGLKARGGETVRLQHIRAGKRLFTTAEWLQDFFLTVAEADVDHSEDVSTPRKHSRRRRPRRNDERESAVTDAEALLRNAGV